MNCGRIKNLLYLKDDELAPARKSDVENHLSRCPSCRKEMETIIKSGALIDRIRNYAPPLEDEISFTESVMNSINSVPQKKINTRFSQYIDKVSLFFMNSAVRAAAVSVILLLISTFVLQQYFLLNTVSRLEVNISAAKENSYNEASIGISQIKLVKLAAGLYNLAGGNKFYADLPKGFILADKSRLNEFLSLYSSLQQYKKEVPEEIKIKYPGLSAFLEGDLTIEKLQEFVKKNENLIKEFSRLNPAGGK